MPEAREAPSIAVLRVEGEDVTITSAGSDGEFGTADDIIFPKEKEKPAEEAPVTAELKVPEGNLNHSTN